MSNRNSFVRWYAGILATALISAAGLSSCHRANAQVVNPGVQFSGNPANNDCVKVVVSGGSVQSITSNGGPCAVGVTAANPTATASDVAVNGAAATFMRSDAAPAVQKGTAAQFGLAKCDGTSITCAGSIFAAPAIVFGGQSVAPGGTATMQGTGAKIQASTGATVSGNCVKYDAAGNTVDNGTPCGGASGANPSATASDVAVNGVSTNFMRADAAPAVQKATNSVFGLLKCSDPSIACAGNVPIVNNYTPLGTGAVARTIIGKLQEIISPTDFGAKCDGSTDDTTALNTWRLALQAGLSGIGYVPGICIVNSNTALQFTAGNVTLYGSGPGTSGFRAKASAALINVVSSINTMGQFVIMNMTIDGNRANAGTASPILGILSIGGSHVTIYNLEITNSITNGIFVGDNTTNPIDIKIISNWIHDNGGNTVGGYGTGLFTGGTKSPNDMRIIGNRFEHNYNTNTGPGPSGAVNATIKGNVIFSENIVIDNFNVNGGQVAFSDGASGSTDINSVVSNNLIVQTTTFGGDTTDGIEINGSKVVVTGNRVYGVTTDGIRIEGTSTGVIVEGNSVEGGTSAAINLINSGGTGVNQTTVRGNHILAGTTGINIQSNSGGPPLISDNYIGSAVTNKITGAANAVIGRNFGYNYTPAWPTYTATLQPGGGVSPTISQGGSASSYTDGKLTHFSISVTVTGTTGVPTLVAIVLPTAVKRTTTLYGRESARTGTLIFCSASATSNSCGYITDVVTGVPRVPTTGDEYDFTGSFEAN